MDNRTIAAIATPLGPGGIGIIRISGPNSLPLLKKLFSFKSGFTKKKENHFSSHHVYYGHLHELDSDLVIDEVLAIYMAAPNSYTKEDVVEIQSHSGYVVLDKILGTVLDAGAELAKPGEFTQRAFLNGRIDLSQAEAVIDLINAPGAKAAKIAVKQLSGETREQIDRLIGLVNELQGQYEALIEFEEHDHLPPMQPFAKLNDRIWNGLLPKISAMIQRQKANAIFCQGVLMTIAGCPNVGKSSLLNRLVDRESAIVSEIPGTTRDVVREYSAINGIPVILCDTAGLHATQDPVESIGIEKAHDHIERAEVLLFVVEATRELNTFETSFLARNSRKKLIVVVNKTDIADARVIKQIKNKLSGFTYLLVSAKTGSATEELKGLIFSILVGDQTIETVSGATPNLRQRKILEKIERIIIGEKDGAEKDPELVADDLALIRRLLEEIKGEKASDDLYDYIFSQFCVGK